MITDRKNRCPFSPNPYEAEVRARRMSPFRPPSSLLFPPSAFSSRAFTLTEVLVVIFIIVLILALTAPAMKAMIESSDRAAAIQRVTGFLQSTRTRSLEMGETVVACFYETVDSDGDGIRDGLDPDDDNDGIPDGSGKDCVALGLDCDDDNDGIPNDDPREGDPFFRDPGADGQYWTCVDDPLRTHRHGNFDRRLLMLAKAPLGDSVTGTNVNQWRYVPVGGGELIRGLPENWFVTRGNYTTAFAGVSGLPLNFAARNRCDLARTPWHDADKRERVSIAFGSGQLVPNATVSQMDLEQTDLDPVPPTPPNFSLPEFTSATSLVLYDRNVRNSIIGAATAGTDPALVLDNAITAGRAILFNINTYTGEVSHNAAR